MKLFTKTKTVRDLQTVLNYQLKVSNLKVNVFKDVPDMVWLDFEYQNVKIKLLFHSQVDKFGFTGTLLKFQHDDPSTNFQTTEKIREEVRSVFTQSFGGIVIDHEDCIQGFDSPGCGGSNWMVNHLHSLGVDEDLIVSSLEKLESQNKIGNS